MNHPLIHSICLSLSAFCLILPASARAAQDPESPSDPIASVVRIPARAKAALSALRVQPRMSIDYGAFVWMEVEAGDLAALESAGVALEAQQDPYTLRLGEMRFDPLRGPPALPAGWDVVRQDVADMHLVQFKAPTRSAWLDQVRDRDVEIIQYIHPHTYIVWGLAADVDNLSAIDAVRWTGPSVPAYRVLPPWRNLPAAPLHTRMLIYRGADPAGILDALAVLGGVNIETTHLNGVFTSVRLTLPGDRYRAAARIPGVYSVKPVPTDGGLRGEMSDQVNVNNVDETNLAFPGYMAWLTAVGLDGMGVIIANVDGGIQDNHPDLVSRLIACSGVTCGGSAVSGHGTHTAGIMAADGSSGTMDSFGFLRGLGVAPGANLVEQKYSPFFTQPDGMLLIMSDSYNNGASLSGNSWGPSGSPQGYDDDTMQVDIGVRDADQGAPGNQPLSYVLSFMNGNGGVSTQGTPDEAKNLFNIGSTKMQTNSGSQILEIDDLSSNTAHGPALDGRTIPHMVAPGCRVDSSYSGSSYSLLCGTSMASPHVSGGVALFIEYFRGLPGFVADPSPALVKAAFLPVARDLAGHLDADGGVLGHPFDSKQGWGRMDLEAVVDPQVSVLYFDDPLVFDNTGEQWETTIFALDDTQPMRVMLVWTDAPGHGLGGSAPAWNNNLDLEVVSGADTYLGNDFGTDGWSVPGGVSDAINNTEGVFIGPTASGAYTLRVVGADINSDGIPGVGDGTDQDFALVCYNCIEQPDFLITATPDQNDVCIPSDAVFNVDIAQILGFSDPVTLGVSGLPAGTSASFDVNPVTPPGASVLTVSGTGGAGPGSYALDISGSSTTGAKSAPVMLNLSDLVPIAPTQISPPDGAVESPLLPSFSWSAESQAVNYVIDVSLDAGFTLIVDSTSLADTNYTLTHDLAPDTLHYWRVHAENGCGAGVFSPTFSFRTIDQGNYHTELFNGDNDLDFLGFTFTPNQSYSQYSACVETISALPTDPTGGTILNLSDNSAALVTIFGQTVPLHGVNYGSIQVGSNGYLTFVNPDFDSTESLGDHFSVPRVSALFDDLDPGAGGTVSTRQAPGRIAVTFENVPEFGTGNSNTFQIEMFHNGDIRLSYLGIDATDGLAGLSSGNGVPADYIETNMAGTAGCAGLPVCSASPGDMTGGDGVNGVDIDGFVGCYLGGDPFAPGCGCADMNASATFESADITAFVDCLLGVNCP